MILNILLTLYLVAEILMLSFIIYKIFHYKIISLKDTIIYPFLLITSILVIFTAKQLYFDDVWYIKLTSAITGSIDLIALKLDTTLLNNLKVNNIYFMIVYLGLLLVSFLSLFSISVSLVKATISNVLRNTIGKKEVQYIFELNDDAKKYINNLSKDKRKSAIVILKRNDTSNYTKDKLFLDQRKVKYKILSYDKQSEFNKVIKKLTTSFLTGKFINKHIYFVSFLSADKEVYNFVTWTKEYMLKHNLEEEKIQFIISSSYNQATFVKDLIKGKPRLIKHDHNNLINDYLRIFIKKLLVAEQKKVLVIFNKKEKENYSQEIAFLKKHNVKYAIQDYYSFKNFNAKLFNNINNAFIYSNSKDDDELLRFVKSFQVATAFNINFHILYSCKIDKNKKEINSLANNFHLYLMEQTDEDVLINDESRGSIRVFDKYNLISYQFMLNNGFARYFPSCILKDNATIEDVLINLYVIGFGKINQCLLKDILIQNQFVTIKDNKLTPVRILVNIYDNNKRYENLNLATGLFKYNKSKFNSKNYFELPDDYHQNVIFNSEKFIGEDNFIGNIYDQIKERTKQENKDKKVLNYFLISFGSDFENAVFANKLQSHLSLLPDNYFNTFFVRSKEGLYLNKENICSTNASKFIKNNIVYFGNENKILTYDNVIADKIYLAAKIESCIYKKKYLNKETINYEWSTLSDIKQASNIYSIASIPTKMALLGFYSLNDIKEEEYFNKYDAEGKRFEYKFNDKLIAKQDEFKARDVLAYIEHERWNAFEFSQGVIPMKKSKTIELTLKQIQTNLQNKTGKPIKNFNNKNENELQHLCLTTSKGLVDYYYYVKELNNILSKKDDKRKTIKSSKDEALNDLIKKLKEMNYDYSLDFKLEGNADVISYDYDIMDNALIHLQMLKSVVK